VTTHELKSWPEFYVPILLGLKTQETRINDRHFKVGDCLVLAEWDPKKKKRTGRATALRVTHVMELSDVPGMPKFVPKRHPGWVVMSIRRLNRADPDWTDRGGR
jgi:uncharacterized protein DUF3850